MKKKKFSEGEKDQLTFSLVMAGIVLAMVITLFVHDSVNTDPSMVARTFTQVVVCTGVALLALVLFFGIFYLSITFLNWNAVRTALGLAIHHLSERIARKNTAQIYPYLRQFLYDIAARNKEFLKLPIGKDASCLSPGGAVTVYRKNCVFYRFYLITPEKPEMDTDTLRLIFQNYVNSELNNYGIPGLPPCYRNINDQIFPSVFLDRVFYDESHRCLTFEVLFVCTEDAARYVMEAVQREAAPEQPEREIFDDDLR